MAITNSNPPGHSPDSKTPSLLRTQLSSLWAVEIDGLGNGYLLLNKLANKIKIEVLEAFATREERFLLLFLAAQESESAIKQTLESQKNHVVDSAQIAYPNEQLVDGIISLAHQAVGEALIIIENSIAPAWLNDIHTTLARGAKLVDMKFAKNGVGLPTAFLTCKKLLADQISEELKSKHRSSVTIVAPVSSVFADFFELENQR